MGGGGGGHPTLRNSLWRSGGVTIHWGTLYEGGGGHPTLRNSLWRNGGVTIHWGTLCDVIVSRSLGKCVMRFNAINRSGPAYLSPLLHV